MAKYEPKSLRNIAVVGHGGTGKTSLCEAMLFASGKTDRLGRVDEGTSSMDFEPEEQKRRISISAAVNNADWEKHRINMIDTPGDANFATDTRNSLRVVDGAIMVVDAVGGVEFQTEKVWEFSDEFSLPRLVFINKMDRERSDYFKVVEDIKRVFSKKITVLYIPVGAEDSFKGIVDLIAMKALMTEDAKGSVKSVDIPGDLLDEATSLRETMVEDIAECDENLMDKYLESGELSLEELKDGLRKGILVRRHGPGDLRFGIKTDRCPPPARHNIRLHAFAGGQGSSERQKPQDAANRRRGFRTRKPPSPPSCSKPLPTRMPAD